jgi:predicted nucleic acid-binding protein
VAFTAFYDASVLYPAPLRDFLLRLALTDLYRAKWSARVHDEWMEALLRDRPDLTRPQLERTRRLMDAHVRDCLVEDFESLIDALTLPDPDDRHVLAAAIRGRADVIITRNLRDFPAETLAPYGIAAQHPDPFITHLLDLDAGAVVGAARAHRASLKNPPKEVAEYLDTLERQGLTQTAVELRGYASVL